MGLITTIQNKTEQARAKERIRPLLERDVYKRQCLHSPFLCFPSTILNRGARRRTTFIIYYFLFII